MEYHNIIVRGPDRGDWKTTVGTEIERQIKACPECFQTLTGEAPKIAETKLLPVPEKKKTESWKPRPRRDFNNPKKIDKTNPNWKYKKELDEIRKREASSPDPRGNVERKKPIVETVSRAPRA